MEILWAKVVNAAGAVDADTALKFTNDLVIGQPEIFKTFYNDLLSKQPELLTTTQQNLVAVITKHAETSKGLDLSVQLAALGVPAEPDHAHDEHGDHDHDHDHGTEEEITDEAVEGQGTEQTTDTDADAAKPAAATEEKKSGFNLLSILGMIFGASSKENAVQAATDHLAHGATSEGANPEQFSILGSLISFLGADKVGGIVGWIYDISTKLGFTKQDQTRAEFADNNSQITGAAPANNNTPAPQNQPSAVIDRSV